MGKVVAHVPKPASVNHGTDTKWGFSEEAKAEETWGCSPQGKLGAWLPHPPHTPHLFLKPG